MGLANRRIADYCNARKVYGGCHNAGSLNVALISDTVPLSDELCRHVTNFIDTCLNCDSDFVRSAASHGIAAGLDPPLAAMPLFAHRVMASI